MSDRTLLPVEVLDRLIARLQLAYGATWLRNWDGLDMEKVRMDWRIRLGWVSSWRPIAWALDNLPPEWPPTAMQFSELCRMAPAEVTPTALPAPSPDAAVQLAKINALADRLRVRPGSLSADEWCARQVSRLRSGQRMSVFAREHARMLAARADLAAIPADLPREPAP